MKWINHQMITFISFSLFSDSLGDSLLASCSSVLPDLLKSRALKPFLFNRPRLSHNPIFWILPLALIYCGSKLLSHLFPIDFLPTPETLLWLFAAGIGSHLLLDAFSDSPIFLSEDKEIAFKWYKNQTPSEDLFVLYCLLFICFLKILTEILS